MRSKPDIELITNREQDNQETLGLANACSDPLHIHRLIVENWNGIELLEHIATAADRTPDCPSPTPRQD